MPLFGQTAARSAVRSAYFDTGKEITKTRLTLIKVLFSEKNIPITRLSLIVNSTQSCLTQKTSSGLKTATRIVEIIVGTYE